MTDPTDLIDEADANRRAAKALTQAAEEPAEESPAMEVYKLRSALIAAFQVTFVMDSKYVFRIAEQIAAELYRRGVVMPAPRDRTSEELARDVARLQEQALDRHGWNGDLSPDERVERVRYYTDSLIERGYRKVG